MYLQRFCPRPRKRALFCTSAIVLFQVAAAGAVDIIVPPGPPKNDTQVLTDPGDTLTVENGGTIDTTGAGTNAVEAPEDDQTVINFGAIDAGVDGVFSTGDRAFIINGATGIITAVDDAIASDGDNSTVINDGELFAVDDGINLDGENSVMINNGLIDVGNDGMDSEGENQTVINNGTIISGDRAIESNYSRVKITNNGIIEAFDDGIRTIADNATVINNGIITTGDDGINSDDGDGENGPGEFTLIINNGVINSGDEAIDSEAENHIIINNGTLNADKNGIESTKSNVSITNNGVINAEVFNGIVVRSTEAKVINRGVINAGDDGIDVDDDAFEALVINSGKVFGAVHAILVDADDVRLVLQAGSVLDGAVAFNGLGMILDIGTGLNLYLDYDGEIDELYSAIPLIHDETDGIIYTVDPSGFALSQAFTEATADAVHAAVRSGAGRGNAFGDGFYGTQDFAYGTETPGFAETGPRGWVSTFGGYQSQNGSGAVTGTDQAYGGIVGGGGFVSDERMYGAFMGGSYARLETDFDTQQIDAASVYGGLYAGARSGPAWVSGALLAGYSSFDSDRIVANNAVPGGVETASADYDGYFISPSVTVGRSIGERTELSIGGHYAGLFLDGYTETGSAANLTVSSRDVHVAAIRGQATYLAHQKQTESGLYSIETWAGVDGVFRFGDNVAASLAIGAFDDFAAGLADASAIGFAGIGFNRKPIGGAWSVNASLEGRFGTDAYREIRAAATAGMRF